MIEPEVIIEAPRWKLGSRREEQLFVMVERIIENAGQQPGEQQRQQKPHRKSEVPGGPEILCPYFLIHPACSTSAVMMVQSGEEKREPILA